MLDESFPKRLLLLCSKVSLKLATKQNNKKQTNNRIAVTLYVLVVIKFYSMTPASRLFPYKIVIK